MIAAAPILPAWVVLPMGVLTLLVIAAHVSVMLGDHTIPGSRKRIRVANGFVMMFVTPLIAFAFGVLSPDDVRTFTVVWTLIIGLLFIVIMLAGFDVLNTARLHTAERRRLRKRLREAWESARERTP